MHTNKLRTIASRIYIKLALTILLTPHSKLNKKRTDRRSTCFLRYTHSRTLQRMKRWNESFLKDNLSHLCFSPRLGTMTVTLPRHL